MCVCTCVHGERSKGITEKGGLDYWVCLEWLLPQHPRENSFIQEKTENILISQQTKLFCVLVFCSFFVLLFFSLSVFGQIVSWWLANKNGLVCSCSCHKLSKCCVFLCHNEGTYIFCSLYYEDWLYFKKHENLIGRG